MNITEISRQRVFGGQYRRVQWYSNSLSSLTTLGIYLPKDATFEHPLPVLYWLSGLTCTDENIMQKSGIQRLANHYGWIIVAPDTSPRGDEVADRPDQYDLGQGAAFYLNATQAPWNTHYRMYDFITDELPELMKAQFPVTDDRALCGHSMGGLGALVIGLRQSERFQSISAFSPICHPSACPWGQQAFSQYLGEEISTWQQYDPCALLNTLNHCPPILIDQGLDDNFYPDQLRTADLEAVATTRSLPIQIRFQEGYDHSYYFIATFLEDHMEFHTQHLRNL